MVLLDDDELKRFGDLHLRLWVNGQLRQDSVVDEDMIYAPLEALQALGLAKGTMSWICPPLRRSTAMGKLEKFIANHPEYA